MNYYETGKTDGKAQFEMDRLTETERDGELIIYTATQSSEHFEMALSRLSISEYIGGFVIGYLTALIHMHKAECEQAASKYDDIESSNMRHIPQEAINRKQYAISAQTELLQTILNEIGVEADKATK